MKSTERSGQVKSFWELGVGSWELRALNSVAEIH